MDSEEPSDPYLWSNLTVGYAERLVSLRVCAIQLTEIEFRVLLNLLVNVGHVLSHAEPLQIVRSPAHYSQVGE